MRSFDFLVLGSGIAGLSYALKVAEYGSVAVVTKAEASEGCTRWAQGGISAVLSDSDSPESHIKDTMVAGDYVNDRRCASTSACTCRVCFGHGNLVTAGSGDVLLGRLPARQPV